MRAKEAKQSKTLRSDMHDSLFKQTGTEFKDDLKQEWEKLRGDDLEKVKEDCNNFMAATSVVGPAFPRVLMNKS
jgi:hypothetical protein